MQLAEIIDLIQGELWDRLSEQVIIPRHAKISPVLGKASTLIGMRRVGKTFRLYGYLQDLAKQGVPHESILFLNLEDDRLEIDNAAKLTKVIDFFYSRTPANHSRQTYIVLDEVQAVAGWERVARRLVETAKCELWLTGSSARMLSKEVATQFRGRALAYEIWPYDFHEFLRARGQEWIDPAVSFARRDRAREQLEAYLFCGGFPEVVNQSPEIRRRILDDYRHIVILRDVVERHGVTNLRVLEELTSTVIANSGKLLSVNKLYGDFKSRGIPVGKDTLFEYLSHLEDAYLSFSVPLYHESRRVSSTTPKKCFCVDTGMVANYAVRPNADRGRLFENLVFLDLKRKGYQVYYYCTAAGAEVDFVAIGSSKQPFVVQVCFDISNEETIERERGSLETAKTELGCGGILVTPQVYAGGSDWMPPL